MNKKDDKENNFEAYYIRMSSNTRKSKTQSLGSKSRKRNQNIDIIPSLMNLRKVKNGHKYKTQADIISDHDILQKKEGKSPLWKHIINLHPDEVHGGVFEENPSRLFNRDERDALYSLSKIKKNVKEWGLIGDVKDDYISTLQKEYIHKKNVKLNRALQKSLAKLTEKEPSLSELEKRYNKLDRSIKESRIFEKNGGSRRRRRRSGTRKAKTA